MIRYIVTLTKKNDANTIACWECWDHEMDEAREQARAEGKIRKCDIFISFKPAEILETIPYEEGEV